MRISTILTFAFFALECFSAKEKKPKRSKRSISDDSDNKTTSDGAMNIIESNYKFYNKVWHPDNFKTFLTRKKLEFDASFMNLKEEALEEKIKTVWKEIVDKYAFGGPTGIKLLKDMSDKKFDNAVQDVINDIGVEYAEIPDKGEDAVEKIMKTIPHMGESTKVISQYLVDKKDEDVDELLNRVMKYVSKQLLPKEYENLIELAERSQKEYSILSKKLFNRAMKIIEDNQPIEKSKKSKKTKSKKSKKSEE